MNDEASRESYPDAERIASAAGLGSLGSDEEEEINELDQIENTVMQMRVELDDLQRLRRFAVRAFWVLVALSWCGGIWAAGYRYYG